MPVYEQGQIGIRMVCCAHSGQVGMQAPCASITSLRSYFSLAIVYTQPLNSPLRESAGGGPSLPPAIGIMSSTS